MEIFDLQRILEAYMRATGEEKKDFDKICLGVQSDWMCHKAKKLMETDPTGTLSAFAMRSAYNKYIDEHHLTLRELINGGWDEAKEAWLDLYNQLFVVNAGPIINNTQRQIVDIISRFGENVTVEDLQNNDFETIFVDAFDKFKQFKVDTFRNPVTLTDNIKGTVCGKLFYFEHYKQFVDALRNSPDDNIIVIALIDRTNETAETEYDKNYDKFFAFGIKREGGIVVVSDRVSYSSPSHAFKTRNPSRDLYNKMDFDHLPYHKLEEIISKAEKSTQLLLPAPDQTGKFKFCEEFDIEGYIYISTLLNIVYDKYFKVTDSWNNECKYFSSDIKFISAAESKELIQIDDTAVILPNNDVSASEYSGKREDIYNYGLFDHYIKRFPVTGVMPAPKNAIATKSEMQDQAWWAMRNAQKEAVSEGLKNSYTRERRDAVAKIINEKLYENIDKILEYTFTHDDNKYFDNYSTSDVRIKENESSLPVLYQVYSEHGDIDSVQLYSIQYSRTSDWFRPSRYRSYDYKFIDDMVLEASGAHISAWWPGDNNRSVVVKFILRSYTDLVKFLNFSSVDELPIELQHWLYSRVDMWGRISWQPYRGNSILSFTDPMNDISDPWNDYPIGINFYLSKSKYNQLVKIYGNKRSKTVNQYNYE